MNWSIILYYIILSYISCLGFVIFSFWDLKRKNQLTGDFNKDSKYIYPFGLFVAFSPITIWFFTYTLIKDYVNKKW